jgi:predicted nucleic acid-binding protein
VTGPRFVFDSSFLIKLHREQPAELYPSLWERLAELLAQGEAVMPREADREIQVKDDALRAWLRERQAAVVESTLEELQVVREIAERHPGWVRGPKNAADPWIIAAAYVRGAVVVTDERPSGRGTQDQNLRIPAVAAELAIECITPTELVRRCGWTF